jgi:hypothetical protein
LPQRYHSAFFATYPKVKMATSVKSNQRVTVFGAYGHTGRFVVKELLKRGLTPVLAGRSKEKLEAIGPTYPYLEIRPASVDNPEELNNALEGSMAIINCAGPFLDTVIPLIEAAVRNRIHYLDMAAEQQCILAAHEKFSKEACNKSIVILPGMGFYGGLADLLATAAMEGWTTADIIDVGIAFDSWMPTPGTRLTGQRNTGRRLTFSNNALAFISDPLPTRKWDFAEPFGLQDVQGFPLSEIITISKHVQVNEINSYINLAPMKDIHNSNTPPPQPADESGRSSQIFLMEVIVRSGKLIRRAMATGRDIYAITAPLIVEATARIAEELIKKTGVVSPGEVFDATDFLKSLCPEYLSVDISANQKESTTNR